MMQGSAMQPGLADAVHVLRMLTSAVGVGEKLNVLHDVLLRIQQAIVRDTNKSVSRGWDDRFAAACRWTREREEAGRYQR